MNTQANTPTSRRVIVFTEQHLEDISTLEHGSLPLTNPGTFKEGVYRGVVNPDGTATLIPEEEQ